MNYENWSISEAMGCVVTDTSVGFNTKTGHTDEEYYGGILVCESVARQKDLHLIAAAPKMLEALMNLENDDNSIPNHAWKLVQEAINAATNDMQYNPLAPPRDRSFTTITTPGWESAWSSNIESEKERKL